MSHFKEIVILWCIVMMKIKLRIFAGNIVVHFASATPMESPASNIDEPISPLDPSKSLLHSAFEQHLNAHANSVFPIAGALPQFPASTGGNQGNTSIQPSTTNVLTVNTGKIYACVFMGLIAAGFPPPSITDMEKDRPAAKLLLCLKSSCSSHKASSKH